MITEWICDGCKKRFVWNQEAGSYYLAPGQSPVPRATVLVIHDHKELCDTCSEDAQDEDPLLNSRIDEAIERSYHAPKEGGL